MKKLIEIHILQNFAPSNLNRDDTGAPKDAFFGGTRRARVSSQCFKRAVRQHFVSMVKQGTLEDQDVAQRTKRVLESITSVLVKMGRLEEESRQKIISALSSISIALKDDGKSEYLLFLDKREIQEIANIINEKWDSIGGNDDKNAEDKKPRKGKKDAKKDADPQLTKALETIFTGGKAVDIALFGRMLTDMPKANQYAACQVAHSISSHAIEREFDFYTAVDDLKPDDIAGADMLGTVEFNSACLYRYANVDFDKLVENLNGDSELAEKGLRAFLEAFVIASPSGKQNSFAAHNPPEFVAITVCNNGAPCNLSNAFEAAIRVKANESLTRRSAEELAMKAQVLQKAFGRDEVTYVLNIVGANLSGLGYEVGSLNEIINKTIAAVKE